MRENSSLTYYVGTSFVRAILRRRLRSPFAPLVIWRFLCETGRCAVVAASGTAITAFMIMRLKLATLTNER